MRRAAHVQRVAARLVRPGQRRERCPRGLFDPPVSTSFRTVSLANALATVSASSRLPDAANGRLDQGNEVSGVLVTRSPGASGCRAPWLPPILRVRRVTTTRARHVSAAQATNTARYPSAREPRAMMGPDTMAPSRRVLV